MRPEGVAQVLAVWRKCRPIGISGVQRQCLIVVYLCDILCQYWLQRLTEQDFPWKQFAYRRHGEANSSN